MRIFTVIILMAALCGCRNPKSSSGPVGMWRPSDSHFTTEERQIIAAAKAHLEKEGSQPVDAYYCVGHVTDGYAVIATFVTRYEDGQPVFVPGGHCTVYLREDGSVIRVVPGL